MKFKKNPNRKKTFFSGRKIFSMLKKKSEHFRFFEISKMIFEISKNRKCSDFFFQHWKYFSTRKKCFFSMGFFLKFIYSFRRIDWERFQSASDNTNPPIIEKRVSIFWIIFLKISWKSLGLNGGWAKVTKNMMKKNFFFITTILETFRNHFLTESWSLSKTLHGARR